MQERGIWRQQPTRNKPTSADRGRPTKITFYEVTDSEFMVGEFTFDFKAALVSLGSIWVNSAPTFHVKVHNIYHHIYIFTFLHTYQHSMWRYIIFTIIFIYLHFYIFTIIFFSGPPVAHLALILFHKFLKNLLVIIIFILLRGYCAIKHASLSWYSASQFEVDLLPGVTPMNLELKFIWNLFEIYLRSTSCLEWPRWTWSWNVRIWLLRFPSLQDCSRITVVRIINISIYCFIFNTSILRLVKRNIPDYETNPLLWWSPIRGKFSITCTCFPSFLAVQPTAQ